ncbi:hypothetical protein EVAR_58874_1 [Eumeta japonica]|uniref:Uncharacterized protein n=1 Tax=Eumeta variegata TaxID=151549 RepID=A0A4C1Z754_EUMVA|nr:hypothetical protein EVAR_58874_1 [Eumeta japonica]
MNVTVKMEFKDEDLVTDRELDVAHAHLREDSVTDVGLCLKEVMILLCSITLVTTPQSTKCCVRCDHATAEAHPPIIFLDSKTSFQPQCGWGPPTHCAL